MRSAIFALAVCGLLLSSPARAEWIFGAKTGPMRTDVSLVDKDPTNTGVMIGYQIPIILGEIGVEAEFTTSVADGEIITGVGGGGVTTRDFSVDTQAAFLAYRSPGPLYFKAKTGFANVDIDGDSESEAAVGVGLGFGVGLFQLELEFQQLLAQGQHGLVELLALHQGPIDQFAQHLQDLL